MNDQHKKGLTLDGLKGKDMFTPVGFSSTQNPTNMGNTTASASAAGGGLVNPDPIKSIYSDTREEWVGDSSNNEIASGLRLSQQEASILLFWFGRMEMKSPSVHPIAC